MSARGERSSPLFNSSVYGKLYFFRKGVLHQVGRFIESYPKAELYDLTCRVIEQVGAKSIAHIPRILSHHIQVTGSDEHYFLLQNKCPPVIKKLLVPIYRE